MFSITAMSYAIPFASIHSCICGYYLGLIAALRGFMGSGNLSAVMAGVTLATLPVIIVFLFAQRFFIEGLAMSGIKG